MKFKIVIVVPAYNEAENIDPFYKAFTDFKEEVKNISFDLLFVDDGSKDSTLEAIKKHSQKDSRINYLSFSRNYGHQAALRAGLEKSLELKPDAIISMDADLQQPFSVVKKFIEKWREGADVVYSIRKDNEKVGLIKKLTSKYFYKVLNVLGEVDIDEGSADFRLLDARVVREISRFKESDLFFRGLVPLIGFKQEKIPYEPDERKFGKTKYTFGKMLRLAVTGITSFSVKPLYFSILLGLGASLASFLYLLYSLYAKFFLQQTVSGWASLIISILFIGGIQLIVLGIIGVYIGKIFHEVKNRPTYLIAEQNLNFQGLKE